MWMWCRSGTDGRCCTDAGHKLCVRSPDGSTFEIMSWAVVLKLWRHIRNPTPYIDAYLFEVTILLNFTPIRYEMTEPYVFWMGCPTTKLRTTRRTTIRRTRWVAILDQSLIWKYYRLVINNHTSVCIYYLKEQNSNLGWMRNVNIEKDFRRFQQSFTIADKEILRHLHSSLTSSCSEYSPKWSSSSLYNGFVLFVLLHPLRNISISI